MSGQVVRKEQCPKCASVGKDTRKDNLVWYKKPNGDYDATCFSCGYYTLNESRLTKLQTTWPTKNLQLPNKDLTLSDILKLPSQTLFERNLKQSIVELYGVRSYFLDDKEIDRFYPCYSNHKLVGFKNRRLPKDFMFMGDSPKEFFGQHLFDTGGKVLIITAGEEDAMSAYQITEQCSPTKRGYPSVSLPNGIKSKSIVKNNIEWLNSFERVIFAVDQEEEELTQAIEYCSMLDIGKGRIARFPLKDASDMCVAKRYTEFYNAIWASKSPQLTGLVEGEDIWKEYKKRYDYETVKLPESWGINSWNYGLYRPSLFVLTAGTSIGKSSVLKHIQYHLFKQTKENLGVISLEEPISRYTGTLMGMFLNKRITLPDCDYSEEEENWAYNTIFSTGRFTFCSSEGIRTTNDLFNKIRYMAISKNCTYVFLDHLTKIINQCTITEKTSKNDHTEYLVNRLLELAQELKICLFLVSHVRKTQEGSNNSYEEGKIPSEDSIFGSSAIKQYSDCTMALSRNKSDPDSPLTIHILKDRLSGHLGKSKPLVFNKQTGWLEVKEEETIGDTI